MACTSSLTCSQINLDIFTCAIESVGDRHHLQLQFKSTCFISRFGDIIKGKWSM